MVETAVLNASLATALALGMAMVAFCLVQPAWFTGCKFAVASTACGVPGNGLAEAEGAIKEEQHTW